MDIDKYFEENFRLGNFCFPPRDFIDGSYPNDFLTENEFYYLMLMYAFMDRRHKDREGLVTIGRDAYNRYIRPIQKKAFEEIQYSVYQKEFIFKLPTPVRYMKYGVALPPLFDGASRTLFQRHPKLKYIQENIDLKHINYIKFPVELITRKLITPRNSNYSLSLNDNYLLLLLYRYNFLETFGGVDFSLIRKYKCKLSINKIVSQYLHIDSNNCKHILHESLDFMEKIGLFQWTEVVVQPDKNNHGRYVFVSDLSKHKYNLAPDMKVIQVIRLYYQPFLMKEYNV